jgi:hypothetical protein
MRDPCAPVSVGRLVKTLRLANSAAEVNGSRRGLKPANRFEAGGTAEAVTF